MTVAGGSTNDPTPNPCYKQLDCELIFFTIDESWLPIGRKDYQTIDYGWKLRAGKQASDFKTLGEWWENVIDKNRIGKDYLSPGDGENPCSVIAGTIFRNKRGRDMRLNSIVSNCAKGMVQVKSCNMLPSQIGVHLEGVLDGNEIEKSVSGVTLNCNGDTDVIIHTNTGEVIPLNGSSKSVAVLDWGAGYGISSTVHARKGMPVNIPLRVKTKGIAFLEAGEVSGSAIINLSYP